MSISKFFYSFFLLFLFISFVSSSSFNTTHKCSTQQTNALLLFKQSLSSISFSTNNSPCQDWLGSRNHPITMNWNTSTDCCKWDGVTCDHLTGDVIGLDLSCGMLQGIIDHDTTLFNLPRLQRLNLAYNDFTNSQIPHEITRLANSLTYLNISHCGFTGQVPNDITRLHKLVSLDLSWNAYDLSLEPHDLNILLQNSTLLRDLSLAFVDIGMVLPTNLNITSSLRSLDLKLTKLEGKLPDNIFNLRYLEKLDLSSNIKLTGPLPKVNKVNTSIISIPLKWLDLSSTNLSQAIPDSFGYLESLTTLRLSYCSLQGSLPKSLINLKHLVTLDLSKNMLNGTLPSFLFTFPSLEKIVLDHNMFSGSLPSTSFIQLVNLTYLDLSHNNLTGVCELDTMLSSLSNLEELHLSYNGLSIVTNNDTHYVNPNFRVLRMASCMLSVFPNSLKAMKNLQILDLSSNNIHGRVPDWVGEIGKGLYYLDLSQNFITGLPQFQWDELQYLSLESNLIQGPIPSSICNMGHLEILDLSNNRFGGVIPQCFEETSSSLKYLDLKSNLIQGPFPPSICNMSNLWYLDMSNNSFDGVIPQCFGNMFSSLTMIDLGNNKFHGTIPNVNEDCEALNGIILNGNQLEGEVPNSLSKCQYLEVFDVGNNRLNGTFPSWLADLPMLQVLVLKSNNFHGPIEAYSTTEFPFPVLQVLDLSHNKFVGHLPRKYFQNFNAMMDVVNKGSKPEYFHIGDKYYSINTTLKGEEQEFVKINVNYVIIDVSNNKFEGEIPGVITTLTSLIVLDLSRNNLTGRIPFALGNLSEIESLDLSWNQLEGEIPRSIVDLMFLGFLNLSQNHLVGRIPKGSQINTFDQTSFSGNPDLCGFPLPKKCEHQHESQVEDDGDEDTESGFTWKVVMFGYGCGTLLGLAMGSLMLLTRRPKWFNAIADAGENMIQTRRNTRR